MENKGNYVISSIGISGREIPVVSSSLSLTDRMGSLMVRMDINRSDYKVPPGLYGIGRPDENSPVFATANYKLTFDIVRENLTGLDAWTIVLDTKGINVWCAAGKGTFGTIELSKRIIEAGLDKIVKHRTVILPQLGAAGVSAYKAGMMTGFNIVYGPVRAFDIKKFHGKRHEKRRGDERSEFQLERQASCRSGRACPGRSAYCRAYHNGGCFQSSIRRNLYGKADRDADLLCRFGAYGGFCFPAAAAVSAFQSIFLERGRSGYPVLPFGGIDKPCIIL